MDWRWEHRKVARSHSQCPLSLRSGHARRSAFRAKSATPLSASQLSGGGSSRSCHRVPRAGKSFGTGLLPAYPWSEPSFFRLVYFSRETCRRRLAV